MHVQALKSLMSQKYPTYNVDENEWDDKFNKVSIPLATVFTNKVEEDSSKQVSRSIKYALNLGFSVPVPDDTESILTILADTTSENVNLIRSIPKEYFSDIQKAVEQSILQGQDRHALYDRLQEIYNTTKNRATLIAKDQTTKITSLISRQRQLDLGITEAIWIHSSAVKTPRPSHVAADGKLYNLEKGCLIEGQYIYPGQLINCHCYQKPVIAYV